MVGSMVEEETVAVTKLPLPVGVSHEYVWTLLAKLHPVESAVTLTGVQPTAPFS
jgi:hypothetical protein